VLVIGNFLAAIYDAQKKSESGVLFLVFRDTYRALIIFILVIKLRIHTRDDLRLDGDGLTIYHVFSISHSQVILVKFGCLGEIFEIGLPSLWE
jgi:hypothetical protein